MKPLRSVLSCSLCAALIACGGSSSDNSNTTGGGNNFASCSFADQNQRFFEYMQEDYFWNDSLPQTIDPEAYDDVYQLLEELRAPEDRYSYILTQDEYDALFVSAEYAGFGFSQQQISAERVKLRFVYQDSPAWDAGMRRADEIIAFPFHNSSRMGPTTMHWDLLSQASQGILPGELRPGTSKARLLPRMKWQRTQ